MAYELRIRDLSSDVCSSDLEHPVQPLRAGEAPGLCRIFADDLDNEAPIVSHSETSFFMRSLCFVHECYYCFGLSFGCWHTSQADRMVDRIALRCLEPGLKCVSVFECFRQIGELLHDLS